ncbi:MAG TPA: tRNA 2-thiouridine(34) synthase MnmA [Ilumatobacteraceae bacterium]|nr:tRNA 2-thiouridine(34) synthase MnmA [Ilumatobacteraceae bacterium]
MKVMVAMSGGVDSSVAAALLVEAGHEVVGVTMRLWGGESDTGCCSVSDVDDARRVAQQLGIDHLVFNFTDDFDHHVVQPYVHAHAVGVTPNPCIECNRHVKFRRLSERAELLGFDAVATGHHARIGQSGAGRELERGADRAKDQSYVVHMISRDELDRTLFPVGSMTKTDVRAHAERLGLRTAAKPDSQDVCFITSTGGRTAFLGARIPFRPGLVVDTEGSQVGTVPAVEMVTLGQRRGIGLPGGGPKQYVVGVDVATATVTVGPERDLFVGGESVGEMTWLHDPASVAGCEVLVQCSAHGTPQPATVELTDAAGASIRLTWNDPQRRIAPGQSIVLYDQTDRFVLAGGTCL